MAMVHIIGAGVAGLAAALYLSKRGVKVTVYEASPQAGGRCRSFHSTQLEREVDNGTHLLFRCNHYARKFISLAGSKKHFQTVRSYRFPYYDKETGEKGVIHLPFSHPKLNPQDKKLLRQFLFQNPNPLHTVNDCVEEDTNLYRYLLAPFCLSALNTPPKIASADMLRHVLREVILTAPWNWGYLLPRISLHEAMIAPALSVIQKRGGIINTKARIMEIEMLHDRANALRLVGEEVLLSRFDKVIVATPWQQAEQLLPEMMPTPQGFCSIINGIFNLPFAPQPKNSAAFTLIYNGQSHWVRQKGHLIYTTTSGVERENENQLPPSDSLLLEISEALGRPELLTSPHPFQYVVEKRATFAATPENQALRPKASTALDNLFLAGDFVQNKLPATLEAAIESGFHAAQLAMMH